MSYCVIFKRCYNYNCQKNKRPLTQWLEFSAYIRVVVGSSPTGTTKNNIRVTTFYHLVEQSLPFYILLDNLS